MKASVKAKWQTALRSGEYEQGQRRLVNVVAPPTPCSPPTYKFCCLGVLADVVDPLKKTWAHHQALFATSDNPEQCALIGGDLGESHHSNGIAWRLTALNDSQGKSFAEIADWIEVNIPVTEEFPVCKA